MKWRFREAERKKSESESHPSLKLRLAMRERALSFFFPPLPSEAFFDQRSFSGVGGEGGHFLKRVFLKRCNQGFFFLSDHRPICKTQ
jgi:hypothetical protein